MTKNPLNTRPPQTRGASSRVDRFLFEMRMVVKDSVRSKLLSFLRYRYGL